MPDKEEEPPTEIASTSVSIGVPARTGGATSARAASCSKPTTRPALRTSRPAVDLGLNEGSPSADAQAVKTVATEVAAGTCEAGMLGKGAPEHIAEHSKLPP